MIKMKFTVKLSYALYVLTPLALLIFVTAVHA